MGVPEQPASSILPFTHCTDDFVAPLASTANAHIPWESLSYATKNWTHILSDVLGRHERIVHAELSAGSLLLE